MFNFLFLLLALIIAFTVQLLSRCLTETLVVFLGLIPTQRYLHISCSDMLISTPVSWKTLNFIHLILFIGLVCTFIVLMFSLVLIPCNRERIFAT